MTIAISALAAFIGSAIVFALLAKDKSPVRLKIPGRLARKEPMIDAIMKLFRRGREKADEPQTAPAGRGPVRTDPNMPGIPSGARDIIAAINSRLELVTPKLGADPFAIPLLVEVEQIRDVHLPKLVRSYVEISPEYRRQIFQETKKSASVHLCESLTAMKERLDDIDKALSRENLQAFLDNTAFLNQRYREQDHLP